MQKVKRVIQKATATPKARRTSLVVFGLLSLLIGGAIFFWNARKKSLIKQQLNKTITRKSNGLYNLSYRQFELDEVAGNLSVSDIHLEFDSVRYAQLTQEGNEPSLLFRIYIPQLHITGVETPRALLDKEMVGSEVEIQSPVVELIYTGKGKDSTADLPPDSLYQAILGNMNLVKLASLSIKNVTLVTRKWKSSDTALQVQGLNMVLGDILIDSNSGADQSRFLFARKMELSANLARWEDAKKIYRYQLDSFSCNIEKKEMEARHFHIRPKLEEEDFMNKVGVQIDRYDIRFSDIRLMGWNIPLITRQQIIADSLSVSKAIVKVYKDHHQPRDHINRVGSFPHQALQRLRYRVIIPALTVQDAFIEYKQNTPKTGRKGKVQFYQTTLHVSNITNDSLRIRSNPFCIARAKTSFMNLTPLEAVFKFNLARTNGSYEVQASLGKINATELNSITEPLAAARIESGTVRSAQIHLSGSDYAGFASIQLQYENLKVAVLGKDEEKGTLDKKGLVSFAANMIIKNDNPGKDGILRIGKGKFERDINRGYFNLLWKSLYVAIADCMGAPVKDKPKQVKVTTPPNKDSIPRQKKSPRAAKKN